MVGKRLIFLFFQFLFFRSFTTEMSGRPQYQSFPLPDREWEVKVVCIVHCFVRISVVLERKEKRNGEQLYALFCAYLCAFGVYSFVVCLCNV